MARVVAKPTNDVYTGILGTVVAAQVIGCLYYVLDVTDYTGTAPAPTVSLPKSEPLPETLAVNARLPWDRPRDEVVPPPAAVAAKPDEPQPVAPVKLPALPAVAVKPAEAPAGPAGPVPSPLSVPVPPRRTVPAATSPAAPTAPAEPAPAAPTPSPLMRK